MSAAKPAPRRVVTVLTHQRPPQVADALALLVAAARASGVTLCLDAAETAKHDLGPGSYGCVAFDSDPADADVVLCVVLGGDGTILRGLRRYAGTGVPVFAVNFGEIGFLATVEPEELDVPTLKRAFVRSMTVTRSSLRSRQSSSP